MSLDPTTIIVKDRQRSEATIDDLFIASVKARLINPIVLRREGPGIFLVAGGRRLAALLRIGTNPLIEHTHYRFFSDLSTTEAHIIELEENIKREDLPWRDQIRAFGALHQILTAEALGRGEGHSIEATGLRANIQRTTAYRWHVLYKNLNSPILKDAVGIDQGYSILQIHAERKAADLVTNLINIGKDLTNASRQSNGNTTEEDQPNGAPTETGSFSFDNPGDTSSAANSGSMLETGTEENGQPMEPPQPENYARPPEAPPQFVINADFLQWVETYAGPKFNIIHVDFPYGIDWESFNDSGKARNKADGDYENSADLYWLLLDRFGANLDKFCSYSAHIVFWFPMDYYESTRTLLEAAGLSVNKYPLIWFKSDGLGIMPGAQTRLYPRRLYETAFLCTRGSRTLVRASGNCYAAPHATNPLHPAHKPEPVLKHFFSMLVDETSDMFDPTCGSGSSLRVANDLGARKVLGLEIDETFAKTAQSATLTAYNLRKLLP